jgi:TRAP-type C4-dicarboxylate transport system substrate-binding protein
MKRRTTFKNALFSAAAVIALAGTAYGQEVTLRLHQFLPPPAPVPKLILKPWAEHGEQASGGRIKIEHFDAMSLGGRPPEWRDQARDGVVDLSMTVVGYTPGRFPSTEVFELPFFVQDARPASGAFWQMLEDSIAEKEFGAVEVLGGWVHGPGYLHTKEPVATPSDLNGMKVRGASRQINALLKQLGATPVGMPVPAIPEAMSKGVIDGTSLPWEVTKSLKISELVGNHTEFTGPMMYTVSFVLVMNKDKYASLPDDMKKAFDDNSGLEFSIFAGGVMQDADAPAREVAVAAGNNIVTLDEDASAKWAEIAAPVRANWLEEMTSKGIDGQALIDQATKLMADGS